MPIEPKTGDDKTPKLIIRNATVEDIDGVMKLCNRAYPNMPPYSPAMIRGQINNYPQGQFVAIYQDKVVGYCATFRISGAVALAPHTWKEITGNGYASRHDANGDYLYGMEVCIDPDYRGLRIGQRLYNERKKLCTYYRLKGIVFAGRIPGYGKRASRVSGPQEYIDLVKEKRLRDPVLTFQLRNGFEIVGLIKKYLDDDKESKGYAVHMVWRNPREASSNVSGPRESSTDSSQRGRAPDTVRLATVQYKQRPVASFEEFSQCVEYFVDAVADYKADFVTFPELFTLQLLSIEDSQLSPAKAIKALTSYTDRFKELMSELAVRYNINIIGGSHPTMVPSGEVQNISYVFLRDGSIYEQAKIHPTPNERYWWNIKGGNVVSSIMTDCGPIGVLICYDSEFPELARHLVDQGALILFVPFCTDERQSYLRVRYSSQARAVENQCYVVLSGNVGNLPRVENMDIQYAQSCILTPCDFLFARDGIAADTTPNVEMVAVADLRIEDLSMARNSGTVQNLRDRRFDLYSVHWHGGAKV